MGISVGDKGIVFGANGDSPRFVEVFDPDVGDKVICYPLGNGDMIAVPTLSLDIGNTTFPVPSFPSAGFDWKLDFSFDLLKLDLTVLPVAPPGNYVFDALSEVHYGSDSYAGTAERILGVYYAHKLCTYMGNNGYIIAEFNIPEGTRVPNTALLRIWEDTMGQTSFDVPGFATYVTHPFTSGFYAAGEYYEVWYVTPNKAKILCHDAGYNYGGNLCGVQLSI